MVCMLDPSDSEFDTLRVNRSREKTYVFDHAFGPFTTQVWSTSNKLYKVSKITLKRCPCGYSLRQKH